MADPDTTSYQIEQSLQDRHDSETYAALTSLQYIAEKRCAISRING